MRIIGPNTSGLFNLHKKVNLLALDAVKPGNVGIVSQSGNMLLALALEAQHNGHIGFSTYVGPGNQTDIGFADYLRYLGEEANTRVATFVCRRFQEWLRSFCGSLGKPPGKTGRGLQVGQYRRWPESGWFAPGRWRVAMP